MGPWESVPATPQTGGGGRTRGLAFRARASIGGAGQQGVMPRSRAAAMPCAMKRPFLNPDATRRRILAPPCAMLRRACLHQGPGTRHILQPRKQERQPTCAACPNLAATAVSLSISPCQFRQDSCRRDWVRFAIFFHRPPAPSARRALSAAMPRARTTAGLARSDSCLAPKRTEDSHPTSQCAA
jgi:hypothetical protein